MPYSLKAGLPALEPVHTTSDTWSPGNLRKYALVLFLSLIIAKRQTCILSAQSTSSSIPPNYQVSKPFDLKSIITKLFYSTSMIPEDFMIAHPSHSLDNAIKNSIDIETAYGRLDLGPVDMLNPTTREAQFNLFFGTTPLSSPSPSASLSRSASPRFRERDVELQRDGH